MCGQLIDQLIGLGVGAYHKNKRGATKIPPAYLIASVQTSWKPHPVRCQWRFIEEITKYGSRDSLSPLCQEGQTAVRRMPRSHVRHRLVRGSDSNNCVLSRLGASLLQLFLRSTCSLLSMFAFQVIRPCTFSGSSHRGVDRSRHAQDYSSSSVVSTLSRRGLLTSRAAIVAPRTPEGDKLTSRAAVVAPRTPEGD